MQCQVSVRSQVSVPWIKDEDTCRSEVMMHADQRR